MVYSVLYTRWFAQCMSACIIPGINVLLISAFALLNTSLMFQAPSKTPKSTWTTLKTTTNCCSPLLSCVRSTCPQLKKSKRPYAIARVDRLSSSAVCQFFMLIMSVNKYFKLRFIDFNFSQRLMCHRRGKCITEPPKKFRRDHVPVAPPLHFRGPWLGWWSLEEQSLTI